MKKQEKLYQEYNELKEKALKDKSLNLKEDLKNKLIELDYSITEDYEYHLANDFSMTTTLDKEEERLEKLINYVEEKSNEQKVLVNEYKKLTGEAIELSYLKYTDNLNSYKERLNNVRKILAIISDIKNLIKNSDNKNETKIKAIKNKLMKKELLNLLYEFCLIDNLDIKEIDIEKLIKNNEFNENITAIKEEYNTISLPEKEEEKIITEPENQILNYEEKQEEEKILTSMPIVEKIGSVVPVNVFESLEKAEEKLPDVVLPTNGLKDDQNNIFVDTQELFEEEEKK